jgi:hypothetical protein
MKPISPTDALFLIGESREHPMHVGSLQLFEPPADAGPHFVHEAYQNLDFGLVGCRRSVPHLQRLLGHLETSLKDLERAVGA